MKSPAETADEPVGAVTTSRRSRSVVTPQSPRDRRLRAAGL